MSKVLAILLGLGSVFLHADPIDFSQKEQAGKILHFQGKTQYHAEGPIGPFVAMNAGSSLNIVEKLPEETSGYDIALTPHGQFTLSGKIGTVPFIMQYRKGLLLCRAGNSSTTYMVPAYAWHNHATRYLFVRTNEQSQFQFFADGLPAVVYDGQSIDVPDVEPNLLVQAVDYLRLNVINYSRSTLNQPEAAALHQAMLTRSPRIDPPIIVIPSFTPLEGEDAFDEDTWKNAARITGMVVMDSHTLANRQISAYLGANADGIYIYFKSPIQSSLFGTPMAHDEGFGGDAVEFFFMPAYSETFDFYQFIGNHHGSTYDSRVQDRSWNGNWSHQFKTSSTEWISIFRIRDFSSMNAPIPQPGEKWRFNLCRDHQISGQGFLWSQFANTTGGYYNYNAFAHAIFGGQKIPFVRLQEIASIDESQTQTAAFLTLVNPGEETCQLQAIYSYYAPGAYSVSNAQKQQLNLLPGERQNLKLIAHIPSTGGGIVNLTVSTLKTQQIVYQQSVALQEFK